MAEHRPSASIEAVESGLASQGYIVVAPNYAGYDTSTLTYHPYLVGEQQRNPTIIRAALDAFHERLNSRAYIQESEDQLRDAAKRLDTALPIMNAPRPANWFGRHGRSVSI